MEGQNLWSKILKEVRKKISASNFKTWFLGSTVLEYKKGEDANLLVVGVKNNFIKEQVDSRYRAVINEAAQKAFGQKIEIVFVVVSLNKIKPTGPIFSGIPQNVASGGRRDESLSPILTFENLVVGNSNNLAYLAAVNVAGAPGVSYNPLLVWGPTGVGKTHILQAIGHEVLAGKEDAKVLYTTSEKFTNDYLESLRERSQAAFRHKYRRLDLLLVDDLQFLAGKESTQDEFFSTFNELYLRDKQIVVACDRHPKELGKLKERLISRFLGGMVVDIGLPDLEMRTAIIKSKCKMRGIDLEEEIVDYLAHSAHGGVRELEGMVILMLSLAKLAPGKIDLGQVKELVLKNGTLQPKPPKEAVVSAVADFYRVDIRDLCGPSRKSRLVVARQALMYLLRKNLALPLVEIGQLLGGRDHSTVIHGVEKLEKIIDHDQLRRDEIFRIWAFFEQ